MTVKSFASCAFALKISMNGYGLLMKETQTQLNPEELESAGATQHRARCEDKSCRSVLLCFDNGCLAGTNAIIARPCPCRSGPAADRWPARGHQPPGFGLRASIAQPGDAHQSAP